MSGVTAGATLTLLPHNDTATKRNTRSISNSVDCLLGPLPPEPEPEPDVRSETASEANTADAQPYLNPRDLGLVPLPSPVAPSPPPRPRGTNQFRSLRMTKHQSRPQLPDKLKAVGSVSRTLSLRGHKRSHSNPGLLEGSVRQAAHTLPAGLHNTTALMVGNGDNFASIAATSSTGNDSIPIQSSSDFAHSEFQRVAPTDSNDDTGDGGANCTGPTGDDRGNVNDQSSDDEDNQSELSGPFEEIDERPPVQGGGGSSGILPLESPAINVPNHYAMIEDYVAMRSAEPVVEGGVEPAPQQSNGEEDTDARRSTFSPFSLVKRQFTKTKKSSAGEASPPAPPQGKQTSPQHEASMPGLPPTPLPLEPSSLRPLPPSPEKQVHVKAAKVSSNIYEVIDESWAGKQLRGGGGTGWTSMVDPSHFHAYEQVVKEFFRDPEVTQHWWNAVRRVVPTEDMAAFPPPFFQAPPLSAQGSDDTMQGGVPLQAETRSVAKTTLTSDLPTPAEEPEEEREPEPGHLDMIESMVRSRDDMIGFINQQLNQSFQSDSDDDQSDEREEEGQGDFSDSELEEPDAGSYLEPCTGSDTSIPTVPVIPVDSAIPNAATLTAPPVILHTPTQSSVVPLSLTPLFSSSSPSPFLSPPRDVPEIPKRAVDCPQVSEKQKKTVLGVGWCTDLDLMNGCDKLNHLSGATKDQTGISTFQSHALEADDSESEC